MKEHPLGNRSYESFLISIVSGNVQIERIFAEIYHFYLTSRRNGARLTPISYILYERNLFCAEHCDAKSIIYNAVYRGWFCLRRRSCLYSDYQHAQRHHVGRFIIARRCTNDRTADNPYGSTRTPATKRVYGTKLNARYGNNGGSVLAEPPFIFQDILKKNRVPEKYTI